MDLDLQLPQLLTDETRRIIDGKTWDEGGGQMSYNYIGWGGGRTGQQFVFFYFLAYCQERWDKTSKE